MRSQQSGFTLVEIAIVLVIIGLLLGGILKGQELINSAKVKNLANDFRVIPTYIYAYQDKYKALPGDDMLATTHVPGALNNGNGDGQITEYLGAPQHLALAGLITGTYNGSTDFMTSAQGGAVYIYNDSVGGRSGNGVRFDNLPDTFAQELDSKMDDGVATTGAVRATQPYTNAGTIIPRTAVFF